MTAQIDSPEIAGVTKPESLGEMSPEEARQYLVRLRERRDLDEHEEIDDELATE